jgi:hypothetical protein
MPIPAQSFTRINQLDKYILPDEGYTKQEAAEMIAAQEWAREAEKEVTKKKMTRTEFEQKATEIYEAAEDEYEETQRILNAPPGSDFVPGLDDNGESLSFFNPLSDEKEEIVLVAAAEESNTRDPTDRFEQYLNATETEYSQSKVLQEANESS